MRRVCVGLITVIYSQVEAEAVVVHKMFWLTEEYVPALFTFHQVHKSNSPLGSNKNWKNLSGINQYFLKLVNSVDTTVDMSFYNSYLWRQNPAMWTEEMTVAGWWEDPSCHSPGSGESRDGNQIPDDWILWGCLAVREAWSKFPVCLPGQSTDWSPSLAGWTQWNVSAQPPGSVDGCSQRFSSAVPEINRN